MKKILRGRKLLTLLLAAVTIVVLTVCAHAAMIEPEAPQTPEEFWDAVRDLELSLWDDPRAESESMNEPRGYESLLPQIEELVKSYANYEEGSLHYKDGILFWRSDGITCGYSPEYRERMDRYELEQTEDPLEPGVINRSLLRNLGTGAGIQSTGFNNGSTPDGVVDVCMFLPYDGTNKNNFMRHEKIGTTISSYTGGTCTVYKGTDADIDKLADAIETCAVVVIGSHGSPGSFGLTTDDGLTSDDYLDDHAYYAGTFYKYDNTTVDYQLWIVDGTVIANHMDKDAPDNLVISSSCMAMKNDALCAPLRDKGVAVVFGFSESVNSYSGDAFVCALVDALGEGMTMADAIVDMRETVGCAWDLPNRYQSYEVVQRFGVAFPIVVSDEDEYPGEGNVNFVQMVGSTWKLPLKADLPGKYVLGLNESVSLVLAETGDPVSSASVVSGSVPGGLELHHAGNQVILSGTPNTPGKTTFTISFSTSSDESLKKEKEVEILVADYANAHTSSQSESWAERDVSIWAIKALNYDSGERHEIRCALGTSKKIDTVQVRESSLDNSLEVVLEGGEVFIRTFENKTYCWGYGSYHVTPPGIYNVTLDCIAEDGTVFQHTVSIIVTAAHTYSYTDSETYAENDLTLDLTATKGQECKYNVRTGKYSDGQYILWERWNVKDFAITGGSLPEGLYMANGVDRPFGIYGTPTEDGSFTVYCTVIGYHDVYKYRFNTTVEEAWSVTFETDGGTVPNTQIVKDGQFAQKPADDPEKSGYDFTGWYADPGCTTPFDFTQPITEDTVVYAGWTPWTYTVIWKNDDGTELEKDEDVIYGDMPSYDGETPTKPATVDTVYTFIGWNPAVTDEPAITASGEKIVYTANYSAAVRTYTVTWLDDDGSLLAEDTVPYGDMPVYSGAVPIKPATAQYTYTFEGWSPALETVTGDATYTAVYSSTVNTYTVLWVNEDGTELEKDEDVPYGETPTYDGATPTKAPSGRYTYTFEKWTPDIAPVTADATYTAVYSSWRSGIPAVTFPRVPGYTPAGTPETTPGGTPGTDPGSVPDGETGLPFTDVSPDSPYLEDIRFAYENGLMIGISDTEFGENLPLTRGMIVTVLHRMEGKPDVTYTGAFEDVPAGEWYTDGVEWAAFHGIVLGYGNGKYGPNDNVTREQLAAILFRYAKYKGYDVSVGEDTNILSYYDAFTWGEWAVPALQWACGAGVLEDLPVGMLRPADDATRGEIAHAIRVFCEEVAK